MTKRSEPLDESSGLGPARPGDGERLAGERRRRTESSVWLKQAGLLTAIPFVLLVGPAVGYYLGSAVDHRWSFAPWGMGGGIVLGLLASARVTIQLIRQAQQLQPRDPDD